MTQADALDILKTGVNVFLTGEPGSGKSHTVREYVRYLQSRGISPAMTASTGIAATHIGGMTIHSWSGLGIRKYITPRECKELGTKNGLARRIRQTSVLIIDEISMLSAEMLNAVDLMCRVAKDADMSFGGMQIVFVGDFFQLPPVARLDEPPVRMAYESRAWTDAHATVCYLSEQHRQEDAIFLDILSALRRDALTKEHMEHLAKRRCPAKNPNITKLYAHNADVDRINADRLRTLAGKERTYTMSGFGNPKLIEQIKRGCLSPEILALKIGAQVMFTRNSPAQGFVNGSTGEVVDFDSTSKLPVVQMSHGRVVCVEPEIWSIDADGTSLGAVRQVPLRLAWAITVHKSQGMSLDGAYIDLGSAFAYGQGYVALSRVRTLAGLYLGGLNTRALEIDPQVLAQDHAFRTQSDRAETQIALRSQEERLHDAELFLESCGGSKEPIVKETRDAFARHFGDKPAKKVKEPKWTQTFALIQEGKTIAEVARLRERTVGTILDHLAEVHELKKLPPETLARLRADAQSITSEVHPIMKKMGAKLLGPIFTHFEGAYTYDDLKIAQWLFVR